MAAPATARRVASQSETALSVVGRIGLAGRTVFYAILAGLAVRIALLGTSRHQADANGVMSLISRPWPGKAAIAAVALGFAVFGVARLAGAWRDRSVSAVRRWMTVAQGAFYLAMASVPASFLAGDRRTGSQQQQQRTTARLLDVPGGRWLVAALGATLIVVCVVQIRGALTRDFRDGLRLEAAPRALRRLADLAGTVGITARAAVFVPVGIFLVVAAAQADPAHSVGTDSELLQVAHHPWGTAAVALVAAGLAVFVVFSAIETRYREIVSAR